jgi:hypothetical protein
LIDLTKNLFSTYILKRHPVVVEAHFDFVLVLTYAFPKALLEPLLSPGLELDTYGDLAFVAVAVVQTRRMKPKGSPSFLGQDYLLVGYRIFVRYKTLEGRHLRGLQILRSDTDSHSMAAVGNLLTHYHFHGAAMKYAYGEQKLTFSSKAFDNKRELIVTACLDSADDYLPENSPFPSVREALKFAGPMPFTFDYERETNSIIRVEGVRQNWQPKPVAVDVGKITFFQRLPFSQTAPVLCSAFFLQNIPYYWKSGIVEKLPPAGAG